VKRSSYIFEEDYLLLSKSSDSDLKDRDTAVSKERESHDKVCKRDLQIDRIESNEEADGSRSCISHEYFAREEVEDQVCGKAAYHDDAQSDAVTGKASVEVSNYSQCDDRDDSKACRQTVNTVCRIGSVD